MEKGSAGGQASCARSPASPPPRSSSLQSETALPACLPGEGRSGEAIWQRCCQPASHATPRPAALSEEEGTCLSRSPASAAAAGQRPCQHTSSRRRDRLGVSPVSPASPSPPSGPDPRGAARLPHSPPAGAGSPLPAGGPPPPPRSAARGSRRQEVPGWPCWALAATGCSSCCSSGLC